MAVSPLKILLESEGFTPYKSSRIGVIIEKVKVRLEIEHFTDKQIEDAVASLSRISFAEVTILAQHQDRYCIHCGNCCRTSGPIDFKKKEFKAVAKRLGLSYKKLKQKIKARPAWPQRRAGIIFVLGKPCPFLKGRSECTIYDLRPAVCKYYPLGTTLSDFLKGRPARMVTPEECPAIKDILADIAVSRLLKEKLWESKQNEGGKINGPT